MGLLSLGTPLSWDESKKHNEHVRTNGITQLINIFKQHGQRENDLFLWGDEVEYMIVDVNEGDHTARLSIDKDYIINDLNDPEKLLPVADAKNVSYHPEYGRFMVESTPAKPYNGNLLLDTYRFTKLLDDSIPKDRKLFDSDKEPWIGASKPGYVYMDSMGLVWVKLFADYDADAKHQRGKIPYDTLAPLAPIMLSLSAAAPIFKGFLVDQDVRWNVVSGAVDDRTFIEKGQEPYPGYHLFGALDIDVKKT
ncbi:Glutamate--cysteine ligase [Candida viswanathii]|uniref:Glutamate--cysteine ligase n=1 Tax=Candida viswanathii TaxID=5486 RepID=A0A367XR28_9ASCO|nr:Glutamate--cysteine ligase [Candida viswanathii]